MKQHRTLHRQLVHGNLKDSGAKGLCRGFTCTLDVCWIHPAKTWNSPNRKDIHCLGRGLGLCTLLCEHAGLRFSVF